LALIDLYPGVTLNGTIVNDTVHLVYRDINMATLPYANTNTWSHANIWPVGRRGISGGSAADTDVHGNMCADTTVLNFQGDIFFGECGTLEPIDVCYKPQEVAHDCMTDGKIWMPPKDARGPIARALLYTQLRYSAELGIELTDCPPFANKQFGYKSQILKWHLENLPTAAEMARNDKACNRWQGNRNPFVDYPSLATQFYGKPDIINVNTAQYDTCGAETNSPTASPNECSALSPGDIQTILMNADNPDQWAFFTLDVISPGVVQIFITNDAWDGSKFMFTKGHMKVCEIIYFVQLFALHFARKEIAGTLRV
jgi:endonuclease I